jgi:hypothetical protein
MCAAKFLRREAGGASKYLLDKWGIARAPSTLAVDACRGVGPAHIIIRNRAYYTPESLDEWAAAFMREPTSKQPKKKAKRSTKKPTADDGAAAS